MPKARSSFCGTLFTNVQHWRVLIWALALRSFFAHLKTARPHRGTAGGEEDKEKIV
jgi:hypothetical protein